MRRFIHRFFILWSVIGLAGCSVFMAANQPDKKDVSVFNRGTPRVNVIAECGVPLSTYKDKDGRRFDLFVFEQGYSDGAKAGRTLFHSAADVLTLGLWELVGTPIEIVADGTEVKVQVRYDESDRVEQIAVFSGKKALHDVDSKGGKANSEAVAEKNIQPEEDAQSAKTVASTPTISLALRQDPKFIQSDLEVSRMIIGYKFFDFSRNPMGTHENVFVDNGDETVTDNSTNLMWQKSGSQKRMNIKRAKRYIKVLNMDIYAGYSDWRIPTVEELAPLLAREEAAGVHLNPVFLNTQFRCWTVDGCEPRYPHQDGAWIVNFKTGEVAKSYWHKQLQSTYGAHRQYPENYIKAVRSVQME